jgi:hypothetical protein
VKTAAFTVHASPEQAIRWNQVSQADGHRSAGTWLAMAADAYLRLRMKSGLPIPLSWQRFGRFRVILMDGSEIEVRGITSPPFGIFQGSSTGPNRNNNPRTLVHLPTRRIIATLRTSRQCRALASELAPALLRGDPPNPPEGVIERHRREAV